jgi:hypothetical protein
LPSRKKGRDGNATRSVQARTERKLSVVVLTKSKQKAISNQQLQSKKQNKHNPNQNSHTTKQKRKASSLSS